MGVTSKASTVHDRTRMWHGSGQKDGCTQKLTDRALIFYVILKQVQKV